MKALLIPIAFLTVPCFAETHTVTAKKFYNSFYHAHTVLQRLKPGDVVITRTIDASGRDENGKVAGEGSPIWWGSGNTTTQAWDGVAGVHGQHAQPDGPSARGLA